MVVTMWKPVVVWLMVVTTLLSRCLASKESQQAVGTSLELQCPSCDRIHCTPRRSKRLKCKGGITRGICNCCPICAKVERESCGGAWDYLGKCDRGLYCEPHPNQVILSPEDVEGGKKPQGTCRKVPADRLHKMSYQAIPAYCKPKCTPDYCKKYPKAICSAIDNSHMKQDCQGDCQHTSCSACTFVQDEPTCVKCAKDDFRCMRKFGRCVRQDFCDRRKFPCKKSQMEEEPGSKFQCVVPQCLKP